MIDGLVEDIKETVKLFPETRTIQITLTEEQAGYLVDMELLANSIAYQEMDSIVRASSNLINTVKGYKALGINAIDELGEIRVKIIDFYSTRK